MEQEIKTEKVSDTALWISIVFFVLVTLLIILVFDNQDNQDRKKIDAPEAQGVIKT